MAEHGKRYQDAREARRPHPGLPDRVRRSRSRRRPPTSSSTPSVEAHLRLGVDPRHADQMVRGTVVLPHGTGKVVRVAVFAQGEKAQEALRAGADEVGAEDLVKKIEAGWLEFDVALATPDVMGQVGRLGRILGRRGLMPNPKSGHDHVRHRARGQGGQGRPRRVQGRQGRHHPRPGRQGLASTRRSWSRTWRRSSTRSTAPSRRGAKGQYLRTLTVATTMGPGIRVDIPGVLAAAPGVAAADHRPALPAHVHDARREASADIKTDGPPQTACARGTPARPRGRGDARGLIRRTGPVAAPLGVAAGDDGEHAEAGAIAPPPGGSRPLLATWPVAGVRSGRRAGRTHRRAPAARRSNGGQGGSMPTEAKRETIEDAARRAGRQPDDDRLRVPRPQGEGDQRDPARAAQAERELPGRQEPPDADRGAGQPCRGRALAAPRRVRRRSPSGPTSRRPPRRSSTPRGPTPRS